MYFKVDYRVGRGLDMKKQLRDMMVYVVIILVACFVGPVLFQKLKADKKNYATVIEQKSKFDDAYKYEEVLHYKDCKAGSKYETVATVWILGEEKKIVQQVKVQFIADSSAGDAYFETQLSKKFKDQNINTVFSKLSPCK